MKDYLRWLLLIKFETMLRRSSLAFLRVCAGLLAICQYLVYSKARRIIRNGLARDLQLTPVRREKAVVGSFYHHLLNDLELMKYPLIDGAFVKRHVTLTGTGWGYLQTQHEQRALLVTYHFGPNQIIIPVLPVIGIRFTQIGVPPSYWDTLVSGGAKMQEVNRKRTANLEGTRAAFIYVSEGFSSLKKAFQTIQKGGVLCVAGDGRIGDHQQFPFLQGSIDIALGGFKLAERFSLPLITVIALRTRSGYLIDMRGPSFVGESNLTEIIDRSVSDLERCTRRHPEQYGWMYYAKAVGG